MHRRKSYGVHRIYGKAAESLNDETLRYGVHRIYGKAAEFLDRETLRYGLFQVGHANSGIIISGMSRLRRLVVSDSWFFITCRILPRRRILSPSEFALLARVLHERRAEHGFLLTAWVFLPDHWHAIFYPAYPLTISGVMESIKVGATKRINRARGASGLPWQPRFFDRALRTVKEYNEKVEGRSIPQR